MVRQIHINSSSYGMPGRAVAVEDGRVVWAGQIKNIGEAGSFDALFADDSDVERLIGLMGFSSNEAEFSPTINHIGWSR